MQFEIKERPLREIARESKKIIAIPGRSSELVNKIEIKEIIWNLAVASRKATIHALSNFNLDNDLNNLRVIYK